jgi:hypothetical protein
MVKLSRCLALVLIASAAVARAQNNARFDLIGPKVEVRVTRGGVTLPIASVPNLQPKDRLWLHPDLPPTQSIRYLLVVVFLRGTTNPPPDTWFTRIEAWDKKVRAEGVEVTVPDEAQQAVLFLAPATGGDFTTLRSAVQGRPGVFVRASQDLNLAGFELGRTEKYLATMHQIPPSEAADPKQLLDHSNRIAGTLALKPNPDCFKLPPDQQYTCLTQVGNQMLLDDGHGQTIVAALTSGASADLIAQSSYTQLAGAGLYSAYVGAIVDVVRIMGSLHTAQYQYIPAIGFPQEQSLNLRLNTPPSFHNPKSVIVIGLPSIQPSTAPPLRPADPKLVSCLAKPGVALPVDGAPLVYSTGFAHDLVLHLNYPAGVQPGSAQPQDIPLSADAYQGGLVLATIPQRHPLPEENVPAAPLPAPANATAPAAAKESSPQLTGTIRGAWGFDPFIGPTMPLQNAPGKNWKLVDKDHHLLVSSTATACVQAIALEPAPGSPVKEAVKPLIWKQADKPDTVDVALDPATLPAYEPDSLHLTIRQFGDAKPETVNLTAYSEPAKLSALQFHAGDRVAMLTGAGLDEVSQMHLGGLIFKPAQAQFASSANGTSSLQLALPDGASESKLPPGDKLTAHVDLKDGRTLTLPVTVAAPRPSVTLLSKASVAVPEGSSTAPNPRSSSLRIYLANQDDLPINRQIAFSLKSTNPFPRNAQIEIASADDSLHTMLTVSAGSLILQDPRTILATLDPLKTFGTSAFGPIRLRAIAPDGTPGDWLPLATLVRLPDLTGLSCPAPPAAPTPPKPTASRKAPVPTPITGTDAAGSTSPPAQPTVTSVNDPPAIASPADLGDTAPKGADSPVTQSALLPQAPAATSAPCTLTGSGLYLIDAIAPDASFTNATPVPEGFVGSSLSVAPPTGPDLYLRLRDDPAAANSVALPAGPL